MDISCLPFLAAASNGRQPQPDEYRNEADGFLYCKHCHTRRERFLELPGLTLRVQMLCACQTAKRDQEEQAEQIRRQREQISRNRNLGLPDPEHRKHCFANDLGYHPILTRAAKNYVDNWEQFYREGTGLLIWGQVGSGKSFLAGCIANALLDRGVRVMMTNFSRLLNRLSDLRFSERNPMIDELVRYPLLIIDDLGIERNSDYAKEQVFSIIDSRYRSGLPIIITTNLTPQEMADTPDLAKRRIYNRILERCCPMEVNQQNIRNLHALQAHRQTKAILSRERNAPATQASQAAAVKGDLGYRLSQA